MNALVVGGTGPTGPWLVRGLLEREFRVSILHRGTHETAEIPPEVEHLHADPFSDESLSAALEGRRFDVAIVSYGRLRLVAERLADRVGRLISIGGVPAYRGYMEPERFFPPGLPVPTAEDAPLVASEEELRKGWRIVQTEAAVLDLHPSAAHFRYPYVYGPRQLVPREWCVVRRILEQRPFIILPDGGLTLVTYGYAENLAHAVLLAVDQPEVSAGQIYNCGDEQVLSLRQVVEVIAQALDHDWEIVSLPLEVARPALPLVAQPTTHHRVLDLAKLRGELGYRDRVPAAEAVARTALWYAANPLERGGETEKILQDPFDYAAEDRLVAEYRGLRTRLENVEFAVAPGPGLSYSAPGRTADRSRAV